MPKDDGLHSFSTTPVLNFKKGLHSTSKYNDPTYLGFVLLFDWTTPLEHSYNGGSPLLAGGIDEFASGRDPSSWNTKPGTAMDYLKRCGEFQRMQYLNSFINTLKVVNYKMPWYWQGLEGLENAWKHNNFKDPYFGGDDAKIVITCLESIDLMMTKLMDLYRKAVYDTDHRRIIIPENLRKFSLYIYVQEIRKFQIEKLFLQKLMGGLSKIPGVDEGAIGDKINGAFNSNPAANPNAPFNPVNAFFSTPGAGDFRVINEGGAKVVFGLEYCEFMPDESVGPFTTISNAGPELAAQTITFSYENLKEFSEYPFMEAELMNQSGGAGGNMLSKWKDNMASKGKQIASNAIIGAADKLKGKLNSLILGNVHGFSIGDISAALQQGTIQGISKEFGEATSRFKDKPDGSLQPNPQNVFGPVSTSNNTLSGDDNVHGVKSDT